MKPLILITNDDGVYSPGLKAVVQAVYELGEILVVAPMRQETAMSRALPVKPGLGVIEPIQLVVRQSSLE